MGPGGRPRGGTIGCIPFCWDLGCCEQAWPAGLGRRRGRGCPVWSWDRHCVLGGGGFSSGSLGHGLWSRPTHCKEGLLRGWSLRSDPGWGQERPGWVCSTGGSLGFLAVSPTSPIPQFPPPGWPPAGPKPQRLKVRGQAGLCTCLYLIQALSSSQLCLEAVSSPRNPSRQLHGQAWACLQLLQVRTGVGCEALGGALLAPGPVILGLSHWLMFWALLGPAHNVTHSWSPAFHPGLGASKIQVWALPPRPHDYHSPPPPVSPGGELTS